MLIFRTPVVVLWSVCLIAGLLFANVAAAAPKREGPTVSEFLGLNTHTVQFKPDRYLGVVKLLRDYHPVKWDLGDDTAVLPDWPFAKNRVDWRRVYGSWAKAGYAINACLICNNLPAAGWRNLPDDAAAYAASFAKNFGPGGQWPYVSSVGIGNEPGHYSDAEYVTLFDAMSKAIRAANPELLITTCNVKTKPSGKYWKNVALFKDRIDQFDVITTHAYAQVEGWPTWQRSYPEDPAIDFLKEIQSLLDWRDKHAPGKPVWVNEFGWDASTQDPPAEGTFKDWIDVSDDEQATYLVRATLIWMRMGVDRGYVYFFDDKDTPSVHASSGIMRHGEPKPAWYMLKQLQTLLGDYRFVRAVSETPDAYVYEFVHQDDSRKRAQVCWSPVPPAMAKEVPRPKYGRITGVYTLTGTEAWVDSGDTKSLPKLGPVPVVVLYNAKQ